MLYHHGCNPDNLSSDTRLLRYTHPIVAECLPTGNVWSWDAHGDLPSGEAVDIVTNPPGTPPRCHVVYKLEGEDPKVVEAKGVNGLFRVLGYEPPKEIGTRSTRASYVP